MIKAESRSSHNIFMQTDGNYYYIIAAYVVTFALLAALCLKVIISYKKQKKINSELENSKIDKE